MTETLNLEKLDLRKEQVLNLKKARGLEGQQAQVKLVLDFSSSMGNLYATGAVQELVERLMPLGLAFDVDKSVDVYLFHDDVIKVPAALTLDTLHGYVQGRILHKFSMGGTSYAPPINLITKEVSQGTVVDKAKGFFGSLFGKKTTVVEKQQYPTYVIFVTDGDCGDKREAEQAIINASNHGIFWQFVGIGDLSFSFLRKLDDLSGRVIDNANFFKTPDLAKTSDDDLYSLLLTEFPSWITLARAKGIIA